MVINSTFVRRHEYSPSAVVQLTRQSSRSTLYHDSWTKIYVLPLIPCGVVALSAAVTKTLRLKEIAEGCESVGPSYDLPEIACQKGYYSPGIVAAVVVSHIQRIGCRPEKTTSHEGQSRSCSTEQGEKKDCQRHPPPPHPPPTLLVRGKYNTNHVTRLHA